MSIPTHALTLASDQRAGRYVLRAGVRSYLLRAGGYTSPITASQADALCRRLASLSLREAERAAELARGGAS